MKSMTGYGRSIYSDKDFELEIELKSLNHRFLDLRFMLARELNPFENMLRNLVMESVQRGKVDCRIFLRDKRVPPLTLNEDKLKAYYALYRRAQEVLGTDQPVSVEQILSDQDVIEESSPFYETDEFRDILTNTLKQAMAEHARMAEREGHAMKQSMLKSLDIIRNGLATIEAAFPDYRSELQQKYEIQVTELLKTALTDEEKRRLAVEIALFIERADVNEEIVRLKDHIAKFAKGLNQTSEPSGKTLNFVLQEMHREITTIGNKFNSTRIIDALISIKEEIERCRELIQNVE